MAKTANDVIRAALEQLNLVGIGEEIDADLLDRATDVYTSAHAIMRRELQDRYRLSGVSWQSSSVPDDAFLYVARYLAKELIGAVPVSENRIMQARALGDEALPSLARLYSRRKEHQTRFPAMPAGKKRWW